MELWTGYSVEKEAVVLHHDKRFPCLEVTVVTALGGGRNTEDHLLVRIYK